MTIKELRDNIDKIDDENLYNLLGDIFRFGQEDMYEGGLYSALKYVDIADYIPIPYSVVESEE